MFMINFIFTYPTAFSRWIKGRGVRREPEHITHTHTHYSCTSKTSHQMLTLALQLVRSHGVTSQGGHMSTPTARRVLTNCVHRLFYLHPTGVIRKMHRSTSVWVHRWSPVTGPSGSKSHTQNTVHVQPVVPEGSTSGWKWTSTKRFHIYEPLLLQYHEDNSWNTHN